MWLGHWENLTIDKPGHWFHSWTIPNFPQTLCENPERDRAVSFKTFRAILSDLNQHARVNGDIEKYKAEELYYHFLLHYFPECSQIAVLRRRYSSPNALDSKADLLINAKGSLIWPSSSERQRNNSDESTRTVYRRGGTLEYFMDLSTNPHSGSAMHGSTDDIPSLITSLLTCSDTEEGTKDQKMDFKDNINVQSTEMFNVGASMDDDDPIPTHLKQEFQQYQHSRLKRKSSSDEHPVWPEYYDNPRVSKKRKSDSDDHDAPIKDEPVDEEIVEMFSKMRNRTDVTMDVPSHDEVEYPLMEANLGMLPDSLPEKTNPFLTLREQREEGIPIWLKLAEAVSKARSKLHGDDLELFERLVSTSRTPAEAQELIQKWREGELGTFKKLKEALEPFNWKERAEQTGKH